VFEVVDDTFLLLGSVQGVCQALGNVFRVFGFLWDKSSRVAITGLGVCPGFSTILEMKIVCIFPEFIILLIVNFLLQGKYFIL
jgi:hypothetical protein